MGNDTEISSTSNAAKSSRSSVSKPTVKADRMNGRWRKQLSPTKFLVEPGVEEVLMANVAARGWNAGKIFFGVTCKGDVNEMDFDRAAERVLVKHPILRCRFIKRFWNGLMLVEDQDLRIPVVRIREEIPWEEVYVKYSEPVQYIPTEAPNLTIYVFTQPSTEKEMFRVFVEIQHWCADGTSMSCLMHDVLQWASKDLKAEGEAIEGQYSRPMNAALRHPTLSSLALFWRKASAIGFLAPLFATSWIVFPLIRSPPADSKLKTMALSDAFTREESASLLKMCRSQNTTLTCAAGIAFCYGVSKAVNRSNGRLLMYVASDTRPVCKAKDHDLSIHVTMTPIMVSSPDWSKSEELAWDYAKGFKAELHKTTSKHLHGFGLVTPFGMSIPDSFQLAPSFMVTSWGAKSPIQPSYGSITLEEAHLRMAVHHLFYPTLSVFSVAGRLNICWKAGQDKVDRAQFEGAFTEGMRMFRLMLAKDGASS